MPDILRLAVDRSLIDISVRRRAIGSIICAIASLALKVDRRRVIALGVIGRQADRGIAELQRVLPRRAPLGRTRAGRDVEGAEGALITAPNAHDGLPPVNTAE